MGFAKDLETGKNGESIVKHIFSKHGIQAESVHQKELRCFYDLSILLRGKEIGVECKYDLYANRSKNVAIEISNSKTGEPAGIMVTRAQIWAHVLSTDSVWFSDTTLLRNYVIECPFGKSKLIVAGGDNNANLILLKMEDVMGLLFTEVSKLSTEKFFNLLGNLTSC